VTDNCDAVCSLENVERTSSNMDAETRTDESASVRSGDAVHAKTSVGTITVLLNRKFGPRLTKASVFDVPDDNAKEVNLKLLKLRRLKRMKKNKDGHNELEGGSTTGRKALQQRISEWKEELLNDQNFKSKRDSKDAFVSVTSNPLTGDGKDKQSNSASEDHKTEGKHPVPALMASAIKAEPAESKLTPSLKSDDSYMISLYDSFMKVTSSSNLAKLDWPREMIQETRLAPKLVYSCNPLYFSFRKLQLCSQPSSENKVESKKHSHQKKCKKTHIGKNEDHVKPKPGQKDTDNLDAKKDKTETRKALKKDIANQLDITKEHTKVKKTSLEHGMQNKKTNKTLAQSNGPTKSKTSLHSTQPSKHKLSVTEEPKRVSGSHSQSIQPTVTEHDALRLSSTLKDTGKSRWDTSSDSETETTQPSTSDWKTRKITSSSIPALSDQSQAKNHRQFSPDDRSRSRSCRSSDSSARSRKRSRYRSASSSASSYSRSSSSYRSSSYSYRHRRRSTSRSSLSYSDTGSDYSRSSHSYSRSRSISRRRHWRSRSYSSISCSPPRRHSGSQLQPHKGKPAWRSQKALKRPHVESTTTQSTKPPTQLPKESNCNSKTDTAVEAKSSSNAIKPAVAVTEQAGVDDKCPKAEESKPVNTEKLTEAGAAAEDVKSIPTPEEHMQSIPLPVPERPCTVAINPSFIGPVLPRDHPLAHKQHIPPTAKFQRIGPNDPLVFRSIPPPPPPPASLTSHSRGDTSVIPPPRPPSPPAEDMEDDIAGDEDPIPQMLDVRTFEPASFIPPEQDEMYGALRRQAELHARRQRIREETGMDIDDDAEEENTETLTEEQLADQAFLDEAATAAMFTTTPVIHVPQQHLVGQPLSTSMAMMVSGAGLVPVQMVPAAGRSLVGLEPSLVSLVRQGQTPTVLAVSPAAAALARAQEEAEAEAQVRQQVAAAQAIAAAQRQRATELVQLVPGHVGVGAGISPTLAALRPAGLSLQAFPLHALASQQPQQQLIQLPTGRIVSVPNVMPSGVQYIAQPQAQPPQLVIGPNGTILRLIR